MWALHCFNGVSLGKVNLFCGCKVPICYLQSKVANPELNVVMVYRYGTGAMEFPCLCLDVSDLPLYLR